MKQITNHPDYYVDNTGNIYSVKGKSIRQLKYSFSKDGYKQVSLCSNGKRKTLLVHKLVAECFIGPRPNGFVIDHIDRNKLNNSVSNLRYVSVSTNTANTPVRKSNSTNEKFIYWSSRRNKFELYARINGVQQYFGSYADLQSAIDARSKVVKEFGLYL